MSYYPPQYGTIQPQYPTYPNQTYYPSHSHYTSQGGHNVYPAQQAVNHLPLPEPHTAPELSAVTDDVASRAMQRFMSSELRSAGFDSVEPSALRRLEHEVVTCPYPCPDILWRHTLTAIQVVEQLYERAHEYANLANRAGPITQDLLLASADSGLQTKELRQLARKAGAKHQGEPYAHIPAAEYFDDRAYRSSKLCLASSTITLPFTRDATLRRRGCATRYTKHTQIFILVGT